MARNLIMEVKETPKTDEVLNTTNEIETNFEKLVNEFYENNTNCNKLKKLVSKQSNEIKTFLINKATDKKFNTEIGVEASISEVKTDTLDTDALIKYLEDNQINVPGLIEIKKDINTDILEEAIYKGNIKLEDLVPFKHTTISYRLNCKMTK